MAAKTSDKNGAGGVLQGSVIEVLRELLGGAPNADQVLAVVGKLVSRNEELERLLALARERRNKGEKLAPGQLDLILDQLRGQAQGELAEANEKLEQVVAEQRGRPEPIKPPKQPPVRRPPPPGLRRVENVIPVPASERACPKCGGERHCLRHEITETIDLIPAEVIVRRDMREVVTCRPCDGEMDRAPMGDKVVVGGAYGSTLVSQLVVEKYWWSKPLNRLKEDLAGLGLPMPSSTMSDQIGWAADLLLPIWRCLLATVLTAKVMHGDGTSIPVRDKDSPTGLITGTLWGWVGDQSSAVYLYTSTGKRVGQRDGEIGPEEFLALRRATSASTPPASSTPSSSARTGSRSAATCTLGGTSRRRSTLATLAPPCHLPRSRRSTTSRPRCATPTPSTASRSGSGARSRSTASS